MGKKLSYEESLKIIEEILLVSGSYYQEPYENSMKGDGDPDDILHSFWKGYITNGYDVKSEDYQHIEQEGGGEGGSEWCHTIFKWKDTYYRYCYSYYSHYGYEHDNMALEIVTPEEKTITTYE